MPTDPHILMLVVAEPSGLFSFLLIGLIAGWLAGKITKGRGFGVLGDLAIGIVGAFLGGFLFNILDLAAFGFLGSLVTATVGALFLLYLIHAIKRA